MAKRKYGKPVAVLSYREYWYEEVDADLVAGLSFMDRDDLQFHSIVKWQSAGGRSARRIQLNPSQLKALLTRLDSAQDRVDRELRENSESRYERERLIEENQVLLREVEQLRKSLQSQNETIIKENRQRSEPDGAYLPNPILTLQRGATGRRGKQVSGGHPGSGKRR